MSAVVEFARAVMSEAEYQKRRDALRATYGDTAHEHSGRFDQEVAKLFEASHWTQAQLALKEGKDQSWVARRVQFGAFLNTMPMGIIPKNLTERRFRSYWEQTDTKAKEDLRFEQVANLINEEVSLQADRSNRKHRDLALAILELFGDGQWHYESTIIARTGGDALAVERVLFQMRNSGTYRTFAERKKGGKDGWKHRIVVGVGRRIDVGIVIKELSPFIKELEAEGRKPQLYLSPGVPAMMAAKLKEILEKLTQTSLSVGSRKRENPNE
jgi:hypothetical protein